MLVNGIQYRTIWEKPDGSGQVEIIDQRFLPFEFRIATLSCPEDYVFAIKEMQVRGAPLIGVTAAYAVYCACLAATGNDIGSNISDYIENLIQSRPTAVNLEWAARRSFDYIKNISNKEELAHAALDMARRIAEEDVGNCRKIGINGLEIIKDISERKNCNTVNILTHCNAGWLATVDYGTATAPIYMAHDSGIDVHVWVDETRPRNQGARLTAWELANHGVPCTVIVDNAGGYLMQQGMVDMVLVGSDRTTAKGYVVNKTGTYLKALAAADNNVPFYVALPLSSIDNTINDNEPLIEIRDENEVLSTECYFEGRNITARTAALEAKALNYAFDITPPKLITGLITEKGIVSLGYAGISSLFAGEFD